MFRNKKNGIHNVINIFQRIPIRKRYSCVTFLSKIYAINIIIITINSMNSKNHKIMIYIITITIITNNNQIIVNIFIVTSNDVQNTYTLKNMKIKKIIIIKQKKTWH
jgi:hypothetical protein